MEKTPNGWTIVDRDAGILTFTYKFTKGASANAFVARMENGELLIISPPTGLTDAIAADLLEFGSIGAIVASNGFHYLGLSKWCQRFPDARCFAAKEAAIRIKKKCREKLEFEPLSELQDLAGANIHVREIPNTKVGETWCWVRTDGGYVWFASDILANMPFLPKAFLPKMIFKLTKSAPGFRVFHMALKFFVKDKKATLRLLLEDMREHEPTVIVPAHGKILSHPTLATETYALIKSAL